MGEAKAEMDRQKAEQERLARQRAKEDEARRKALEDERRKLENERRRLKKLEEEKEAEYQRQRDSAEKERQRKVAADRQRQKKKKEEEKEAEMERQRKKNNHEWDINCKGDYLKVNGQIVTGSAAGSIWIKGIVSEATHEWKFKTLNAKYVRIGITNEKNEKKKDSEFQTLFYSPHYGCLYDADGNKTETNVCAEKNHIVSMKLDLENNKLKFMKNGKQIGNAMAVKNGSYRAAVSFYNSSDSIELLSN